MSFFEKNSKALEKFAQMSVKLGARCDYVQGGGGNTSVKLEGGRMAIKASGYCLSDITPKKAYAVLDGGRLREFYKTHEPDEFADAEKAGSEEAKSCTKEIDGLQLLRPSVEAGFHSLLKKYVSHTHSVYANMAACAAEGKKLLEEAMSGADYACGFVRYVNPGALLTFSIRDEQARVERETGKNPSVILMENHGIIVTDDDADRCAEIHDDANKRIAALFGSTGEDFPSVGLESRDGLMVSATPYLRDAFVGGILNETMLLRQPLYPDQMVFLSGTLFFGDTPEEGMCTVDPEAGIVIYRMAEAKARVIEETLTAVAFITEHIRKAGYTVQVMGEAAKDFIANWESEKYRKSLAGK